MLKNTTDNGPVYKDPDQKELNVAFPNTKNYRHPSHINSFGISNSKFGVIMCHQVKSKSFAHSGLVS